MMQEHPTPLVKRRNPKQKKEEDVDQGAKQGQICFKMEKKMEWISL